MKNLYLITLTLISLNSIGQSIGNDSVYGHWPTSEEIIELRMLNDMLPLVNAWDKYSVECYNDSTVDSFYDYHGTYNVNTSDTYILKNNEYVLIKSNTLYNHKQPTFTDFMEWLKTKY